MSGNVERMGFEKLAKKSDAQREKGSEEYRECDGRTALRKVWNEWEGNNSNRWEMETDAKERSERKVTGKKTKKKTTVTMASLTPDDRNARRRTTYAYERTSLGWWLTWTLTASNFHSLLSM